MSSVVSLRGSFRLDIRALDSWTRLEKAYGDRIPINSSYREPSSQIKLFLSRYIPQTSGGGKFNDVKYYKGVRYVRWSDLGTVAVPGTSLHEQGLAVDVDKVARSWIMANGERFGWVNPAWAKLKNSFEPWHFEYVEHKDITKTVLKGWDEMATKEELRQVFMEVLGGTDIAGAVLTRDLGGKSKPDDIVWYILKETQNNTRQIRDILERLEGKQ